jgi:hypothetical protein
MRAEKIEPFHVPPKQEAVVTPGPVSDDAPHAPVRYDGPR